MDLTEVLNQKLNKLTSDFIEFQKDLQTCFESLAKSEIDEQRKEILRFLVKTQMEIAKTRDEIDKVEKQIELVIDAEAREFKEDFTDVYSKQDARLLKDAFNMPSIGYQNNTHDLDEPMKR